MSRRFGNSGVLFLSLVLLLATEPTLADIARPVSDLQTEQLFQQSDLVCSGTVVRVIVETEEPYSNRDFVQRTILSEMKPHRTYKGDVADIVRVRFKLVISRNAELPVPRYIGEGSYQLLFLRKSGEDFSYTDKNFGRFNPSQKLSKSTLTGIELLERDLAEGLFDPSKESVYNNVLLLFGFPKLTSTTTAEMKLALTKNDPGVNTLIYATLLKNRDYALSTQMVSFVNQYSGDQVLTFDLQPLIATIATLHDRTALPFLITISSAANVYIRRAAMDAMRSIASIDCIPALVTRLDDSDLLVRLLAVKGLAEITHHDDSVHSPSMPEFQNSPEIYVSIWKQWWSTEGKSKYASH